MLSGPGEEKFFVFFKHRSIISIDKSREIKLSVALGIANGKCSIDSLTKTPEKKFASTCSYFMGVVVRSPLLLDTNVPTVAVLLCLEHT